MASDLSCFQLMLIICLDMCVYVCTCVCACAYVCVWVCVPKDIHMEHLLMIISDTVMQKLLATYMHTHHTFVLLVIPYKNKCWRETKFGESSQDRKI